MARELTPRGDFSYSNWANETESVTITMQYETPK